MRSKIIAANWKMNKTHQEGIDLITQITTSITLPEHVKVIFATPYIHLWSAKQILKQYNQFFLGAQNCSSETSGAFTGEISAKMLQSIGTDYVILGHSERRQIFSETDEIIRKKIEQALNHNLKVILCVGETLEQRQNNQQEQIVNQQITYAIKNLSQEQLNHVTIAYEPIWAIGTGQTANSEQIAAMHSFIYKTLQQEFGLATAQQIPLLYGGSCNAKNVKEIFAIQHVDGGLVGGASLQKEDFKTIIEAAF